MTFLGWLEACTLMVGRCLEDLIQRFKIADKSFAWAQNLEGYQLIHVSAGPSLEVRALICCIHSAPSLPLLTVRGWLYESSSLLSLLIRFSWRWKRLRPVTKDFSDHRNWFISMLEAVFLMTANIFHRLENSSAWPKIRRKSFCNFDIFLSDAAKIYSDQDCNNVDVLRSSAACRGTERTTTWKAFKC